MRILTALLATVVVLAVPAAANASPRTPYRTVEQAENFIAKRVYTGTYYCLGRHTDRPGTALYSNFLCLTQDWTHDTAAAWRLDARPHGRWHVHRLG